MAFEKFLEKYPPAAECKPLEAAVIEKYKDIVPASLVEFWQTHGTGKYGEGMLEIINPDLYRQTLETWLGKEVPNYIPIAMSNFGDLYYFRKLSEEDEDICVIDPCYRDITTLDWNMEDFFDNTLAGNDYYNNTLRRELFLQAVEKKGPLAVGEIYLFEPALSAGGAEEIEHVGKGNGIVHLDLLFQMG